MSDQLEKKVGDLSLKETKFNLGAMEFVPSWAAPVEEPAVEVKPAAKVMSIGSTAPTAKVMSIGSSVPAAKVMSIGGGSTKPEVKATDPVKETSAQSKTASPELKPQSSVQPAVTEDSTTAEDLLLNHQDEEDDVFDVTELGKEHLNIIFIGHVDAGKHVLLSHLK